MKHSHYISFTENSIFYEHKSYQLLDKRRHYWHVEDHHDNKGERNKNDKFK